LIRSGLVHAACGRRGEAIRDLMAALRQRSDDAGLTLVIGHLLRLQGQYERAIRLHRMLLVRPATDRHTRVSSLVALALDYRTAGLLKQARLHAEQALALDAQEPTALDLLTRLHETAGEWQAALHLEERLLKAQPGRSALACGFLHYQIGCDYHERGQTGRAARRLLRALKVHDRVMPAYVRLGDVHYENGRPDRAVIHWERLVDRHPRYAHLVFERLEGAYTALERTDKLEGICRRLADANPSHWRSRLYLAEAATRRGLPEEAARRSLEALEASPRSLAAHREYWRSAAPSSGLPPRALRDFLKATSGAGAGDDPHVCTHCRYRASELLWRCPQCHTWGSFLEDRG
jgi:lipopolysaccharide biosynthesis regulator YciM